MDSQQSKQLIIQAWQAFASRDPQRISAVFADDAEWIAPKGNATAVALDYTNHMIGRDQIVQFIAAEMQKLFHDVKVDFRGFYADGNTVIVEERMRATLSNGRHYELEYCFVFELEGNLIKRVREYMDTLGSWRMVFG